MNVLSLFDGISCGQIALEQIGVQVATYFASEIDKYAIIVTQSNYPNTKQIGDVKNVRADELPSIDMVIGGSPCQDLSKAKVGVGLRGKESRLLFEFIRLLRECNPKWFLLENVVPRKIEWRKQIDCLLGVKGTCINSDLFVPQNRPRIYWTNIDIPELPKRPNWNSKYFQYRRTYYRENKSGVCPCLTANMGMGGHNVPLKSKNKKDKLSVIEVERLQSVPDDYTRAVSNSRRYHLLGNCWTVDVIAHIFKGLVGEKVSQLK